MQIFVTFQDIPPTSILPNPASDILPRRSIRVRSRSKVFHLQNTSGAAARVLRYYNVFRNLPTRGCSDNQCRDARMHRPRTPLFTSFRSVIDTCGALGCEAAAPSSAAQVFLKFSNVPYFCFKIPVPLPSPADKDAVCLPGSSNLPPHARSIAPCNLSRF